MLKNTTRTGGIILTAACGVLIGMSPFHSERIAAQDNAPTAAEKKEAHGTPGEAKTDIRDIRGDSVPVKEKKPAVEKDKPGKKTEPAKEAGRAPVKQEVKKKQAPKRDAPAIKNEKKADGIREPEKKKQDTTGPKKIEPARLEPGRKEAAKIEPRGPSFIVINMGDPAGGNNLTDWHRQMNYREIARWGRTYGLRPHRDASPVDSGAARFVSRFGSKVTVDGLDPGRRYRLWVDFVTYDIVKKNSINARLEIYADREKVGNFNFASIKRGDNPVSLDLPYHLTMKGRVELLFREYSDQGGFWGIWDLVISDAHTLPGNIDDGKTRPSGMIEGDRIVEPPRSGREKIQKGTSAPEQKEAKKNLFQEILPSLLPGPKSGGKAPVEKETKKRAEPKKTVEPAAPREPRMDDGPAAPRGPKTPEAPK